MISAASDAATTSAISGEKRSIETSLIMSTPQSSAARATPALRVSTDRIADGRSFRSSRSTGTTRSDSSSAGITAAPGRVDSPPISSRSAPSSRRASARSTAVAGEEAPPSLNESPVTLTIPISSGRVRSRIISSRRGITPRFLPAAPERLRPELPVLPASLPLPPTHCRPCFRFRRQP